MTTEGVSISRRHRLVGLETDLVGAKVSCSGLLIDRYWHARSPPLSYTAILLDYRSNHWLSEEQLAIKGSSMAETLTRRGIHVVG